MQRPFEKISSETIVLSYLEMEGLVQEAEWAAKMVGEVAGDDPRRRKLAAGIAADASLAAAEPKRFAYDLFEELYHRHFAPVQPNGKPYPPFSPERRQWLPHCVPAMRRLRRPRRGAKQRWEWDAERINDALAQVAVRLKGGKLRDYDRERGPLLPWLQTIAANELNADLRGRVRERLTDAPPEEPAASDGAAQRDVEGWKRAAQDVWDAAPAPFMDQRERRTFLRQRGVLQLRFGFASAGRGVSDAAVAATFGLSPGMYHCHAMLAAARGGYKREQVAAALSLRPKQYDRLLQAAKRRVGAMARKEARRRRLPEDVPEAMQRGKREWVRGKRTLALLGELRRRTEAGDLRLAAMQMGFNARGAATGDYSSDRELARRIRRPLAETRRRLFEARGRLGSVVARLAEEFDLRGVPRLSRRQPRRTRPRGWPQLIRQALDTLTPADRRLVSLHLQIPFAGMPRQRRPLTQGELAAATGEARSTLLERLEESLCRFIARLKELDAASCNCLDLVVRTLLARA